MNTPRFCSNCGAPLNPEARFCGQCGHAVQAAAAVPVVPAQQGSPSPAPQPVPQARPVQQVAVAAPVSAAVPAVSAVVPPVAQTETIVSIIPGFNRHRGFLGLAVDNYTLILTPGRLIFAHLDTNTMKALVNEARNDAKAQGKGTMGQWAAQMGWLGLHVQRLQAMTPAAILAQFPGSFFIPNNAVSKVRVKQVSTGSDDTSNIQTQVHIDTTAGKHKFVLAATGMSPKQLKQRLQQTLGAIVR